MSNDQGFITDQIAKGIYTLDKQHKDRSLIWNVLSEIHKEDGSTLSGLVYCRTCCKLLKYPLNQSSNLSRHKCCLELWEQQKFKTVTAVDKKKAIDICTTWIIEDCRPFSTVSSLGFKKLAKFFFKIGATYGEHVDLDDLLPDAATMSRKAQKKADKIKNEVKGEISDAVNSGGASATIDMWTDNYVRRNFLGVTLQYQKECKIYDIVLGIKSMDFERSTGVHILTKLKSLFSQFGINNFEAVKLVTDKRKNIVKALENNVHLNCSSHLLANVLDQSFEETAELAEIVQACRGIVKYIKKENVRHKQQTSLKNPCNTGWKTHFKMFKCIVDNWFEINEKLKEKEATQRLSVINISTLQVLVDLCAAVEIVVKKIELCNSPTLFYVIPSINKIKGLCVPNVADAAAVAAFKKTILDKTDCIWVKNLSLWHKAACFLYPPDVNLQPNDLIKIQNFCISKINELENIESSSFLQSASKPNKSSSPSESVTQSFEHSLTGTRTRSSVLLQPASTPHNSSSPSESVTQFTEYNLSDATLPNPSTTPLTKFFVPRLFERTKLNIVETPREEVERYSKEIVPSSEDFDVMKWWQKQEKNYPNLSKLALQIHAIPASSAAAERAFSLANNIITEERNILAPKSVDSALFLHNYFKNLEN